MAATQVTRSTSLAVPLGCTSQGRSEQRPTESQSVKRTTFASIVSRLAAFRDSAIVVGTNTTFSQKQMKHSTIGESWRSAVKVS